MKLDLTIPEIQDEELKQAVFCLTRSATLARNLLIRLMNGENAESLMQKHGQMLFIADAVIDHWDEYVIARDTDKPTLQ